MNDRLRERATAARTRRRAKRARTLATLALLATAGWVVFASPVFALEATGLRVQINGDIVDADAVTAVLTPFVGTPLTRLNTGDVAAVVAMVPGVESASVVRAWPHGIEVRVQASQPVAAVPGIEGGFVLVDSGGAALATVEAAPDGVPVLIIPLGGENARVLAAALTVATALPPSLSAQVASITANTEDSVTIELIAGTTVVWGSGEDSALKAQVLQVLLGSPAAATASVIDVSAPTRPVTTR